MSDSKYTRIAVNEETRAILLDIKRQTHASLTDIVRVLARDAPQTILRKLSDLYLQKNQLKKPIKKPIKKTD